MHPDSLASLCLAPAPTTLPSQVHNSLSHYNDRSTDFYASSYQDNFCKFAQGQSQPGAPAPHQFPPQGMAKDKYRINGVLGTFVHPLAINDLSKRAVPPEGTAAAAGIANRLKAGGTMTASEMLKLKLIQEARAKEAPPPLKMGEGNARRTGRNCTHADLPFYRPGYGA